MCLFPLNFPEEVTRSPQTSSTSAPPALNDITASQTRSQPTSSINAPSVLKDITNSNSNQLVRRLKEDLKKKDEEIFNLRREVQKSRLDAATARKKLGQVEQQLRQQQQQQQRNLSQQQQQLPQQQQQHQRQQRYDPYYNLDHDVFNVGDDITIPSSDSRAAFDAKTPAKFIRIMSHAIWGVETLSQRVVRTQKNTTGRNQLTPRKKELLQTHYRYYLEQQNYSQETFNKEVKEATVNKYLDNAIQVAKKKN
ncbi:hypothetical protein KQX54_003162 [Cotesia glomerata]|uniref:Uncharacterized protein n=1 Tax=Cotesia glomerata TaxID=32391 RepID=A0AAV7J2U4_COTGL|nr:hypothetical protein KQX54_003162 [Cotesia glomerata]